MSCLFVLCMKSFYGALDVTALGNPSWLEKIQITVKNILHAVNLFQTPLNISGAFSNGLLWFSWMSLILQRYAPEAWNCLCWITLVYCFMLNLLLNDIFRCCSSSKGIWWIKCQIIENTIKNLKLIWKIETWLW